MLLCNKEIRIMSVSLGNMFSWKNCKEAHNGLVIVKLEGSLATAEPVIRNDF